MFDILFRFIAMYVSSLNYISVTINMFKLKRKEAVVFDIFFCIYSQENCSSQDELIDVIKYTSVCRITRLASFRPRELTLLSLTREVWTTEDASPKFAYLVLETCADLMLSHQTICLIFSVLRPCSGLPATKNNITHWKCQTFKRSTSHCFHILELKFVTTTFLFTIVLIAHEAASVKTGRDSDHFSNISLTECQEAFRKALENKIGHALSGADIRTWSVGIDPPFRINFCENPALKWPSFLRQSILKWLAQTYRTLQIPPPPPPMGRGLWRLLFSFVHPKTHF